MQKFVKQVMVVGAVVGMGVSACTALVSAKDTQHTDMEVELKPGTDIKITKTPTITLKGETLDGSHKTLTSESMDQPLEVNNPGFSTGWTVDASLSKFTGDITKKKLAGEKFMWYPGKLDSEQSMDSVTVNNAAEGIELNDQQKHIMTANVGAGVGTFSLDSGKAALEVSGNALADTYRARITWTLVNSVNEKETLK